MSPQGRQTFLRYQAEPGEAEKLNH